MPLDFENFIILPFNVFLRRRIAARNISWERQAPCPRIFRFGTKPYLPYENIRGLAGGLNDAGKILIPHTNPARLSGKYPARLETEQILAQDFSCLVKQGRTGNVQGTVVSGRMNFGGKGLAGFDGLAMGAFIDGFFRVVEDPVTGLANHLFPRFVEKVTCRPVDLDDPEIAVMDRNRITDHVKGLVPAVLRVKSLVPAAVLFTF